MNELNKRLETLLAEVQNLKQHLNLEQKRQRILELEELMQGSNFWADNEHAQKVSKEYNQLKGFYDFWMKLEQDIQELLELMEHDAAPSVSPDQEDSQPADDAKQYLEKQVADLEDQYKKIAW